MAKNFVYLVKLGAFSLKTPGFLPIHPRHLPPRIPDELGFEDFPDIESAKNCAKAYTFPPFAISWKTAIYEKSSKSVKNVKDNFGPNM